MAKMQVVLLAGGLGTRLAEETDRIPKPMVSIGSKPILWHIMKSYSSYGMSDFIICGGYKNSAIIEYFVNYRLHVSNISIDIGRNQVTYLNDVPEDWKITIIDTGEHTQTGGRLKRVREYLTPGQPFCMTYGDGVSDVDLGEVIAFHQKNGFEATLTAVRPPARFGSTIIENGRVTKFSEKPVSGEGHINGGYFVLNHSVFDLIEGDDTVWEHGPLETLAQRGALGAYVHEGFWQPMDTLRDRRYLEHLWLSGQAPWKRWR
jgi:glucose-1-phosphate cytidylyltransferase